jgi:hypothetical protein
VRQGLYIENLARDHLATIVITHITKLFDKKRAGVDTTDYIRLVDMDHKWQRDRPYYNAGTGIIALVKHPQQ